MKNMKRLTIVSTLVLIGAAVFAVPVLASPSGHPAKAYTTPATATATTQPAHVNAAATQTAVAKTTAVKLATNAARVATVAIAGARACTPPNSVKCQTLLKKAKKLQAKAIALAKKAGIKPAKAILVPLNNTGAGGTYNVGTTGAIAGTKPVVASVSHQYAHSGANRITELPRTGGAAH